MPQIIRQLLLVSLCVTGVGCSSTASDHSAEVRRQVLRGNELTETRRRVLSERRVTDDKGALIPSNITLAGITIPRGFEPKYVFEHEWHYDGQLSLKELENYFRAQLDATITRRANDGSTLFAHATVKSTPNMAPVAVTILPIPGREDWSRIQILAGSTEATPNPAQVQAELTVRRHKDK